MYNEVKLKNLISKHFAQFSRRYIYAGKVRYRLELSYHDLEMLGAVKRINPNIGYGFYVDVQRVPMHRKYCAIGNSPSDAIDKFCKTHYKRFALFDKKVEGVKTLEEVGLC